MRILSALKSKLVPDEAKPRRILSGPFRGIKLELSLSNRLQTYLGLFERETHGWIKTLSRDIRTAIDVGAAEGEYALFFLLGTTAENVYAFEPDSSCLAVFARNARLNSIDVDSKRLSISKLLVGRGCSENVVALDSLAGSVHRPCLIKLDVDGGEEDVLLGATTLNSLPGIRWLIETHSADLEQSCIRLLKTAGFQTKVIKTAWWRSILPEMRPLCHNRWLAAWKTDR
jgi:hypothetical protein